MTSLGKYQLGEVLGVGGMGTVYAATQGGERGFSKPCVVKVLHPNLLANPELTALFEQEARIAALMAHPAIPQVFDYGVEGQRAYLAMERVEGPTLLQCIERHRELQRPVSPAIAARVMASVCEALAYVHALKSAEGSPLGLVHRDVSPDNIIVSTGGAVKLTDFGVMRLRESVIKTDPGLTRGKYRYMSPEQLVAGPLTAQSDVFSVGVVLCELLTLQHPWPGASDSEFMLRISGEPPRPVLSLRADVPEPLAALIHAAIAKSPALRPRDCRALHQELEAFIVSTRTSVTAFDVAQWLVELDPPADDPGATLPMTPAEPGEAAQTLDSPSGPAQQAAALAPGAGVPASRATALRPGLWALLLAVALGVAVLGVASAIKLGSPQRSREVPPLIASVTAAPKPVEPQAPEPTPDAGAELDAQSPEVQLELLPLTMELRGSPRPARAKRSRPAAAAAAEVGVIEVRVRPWAVVHVDGKLLGETPIEDVKLSVGRHTIRLTNAELGKDVTFAFDVRPGPQQIKYHLLQ